ncbi:CLUMA_CG006728, isoform A [Clunio marinus]|uniref:CLUMA_CG006728, isoform A n=1 Tax=Clunio marinus TaxID=568069 RepID=A0A1J1HYK3_9DIPT|nr:CLUMA_CG006728, isoform A [Clunio marinus]
MNQTGMKKEKFYQHKSKTLSQMEEKSLRLESLFCAFRHPKIGNRNLSTHFGIMSVELVTTEKRKQTRSHIRATLPKPSFTFLTLIKDV